MSSVFVLLVKVRPREGWGGMAIPQINGMAIAGSVKTLSTDTTDFCGELERGEDYLGCGFLKALPQQCQIMLDSVRPSYATRLDQRQTCFVPLQETERPLEVMCLNRDTIIDCRLCADNLELFHLRVVMINDGGGPPWFKTFQLDSM